MIAQNNTELHHTEIDKKVEKPILEIITMRLSKMEVQLRENRMNPLALQICINVIRAQLSKIYGKDAEVLRLLPQVKGKLNPQAVTEMARVSIESVKKFIQTIQDAGVSSFDGRKHGKIFIGHGRSPMWRELKDFLSERLGLSWDEFNREAVAGVPTFERIAQMLSEAEFAFLLMTAEDAHLDNSFHARENVVHEVGLFQGKLGPMKAIILLEEGCEEFSNIIGLSQIRFKKGNVSEAYEKIREVLEREGVI